MTAAPRPTTCVLGRLAGGRVALCEIGGDGEPGPRARIEQLLARSPDDLRAAIAAAERSIDEELSRVNDTHTRAVLGDDPLTAGEVERLQTALAAGRNLNVSIGDEAELTQLRETLGATSAHP